MEKGGSLGMGEGEKKEKKICHFSGWVTFQYLKKK